MFAGLCMLTAEKTHENLHLHYVFFCDDCPGQDPAVMSLMKVTLPVLSLSLCHAV